MNLKLFFCLLAWTGGVSAQDRSTLEGVVVDDTGASIVGASVEVHSAQGAILANVKTQTSGKFLIEGLPVGSYELIAHSPGLAVAHFTAVVSADQNSPVKVQLTVARAPDSVTVTASRGSVEDVSNAGRFVTTVEREGIVQRPLATIANALENTPGVMVQQTTNGNASPHLRGLTGYQTLLLLDGIRFNTSIFRSGPNQYLGLVDPSQAQRIEVILGPTGSAYGSDSLGGTINVLTVDPRFSATSFRGWEQHGEFNMTGASADMSGALNGRFMTGTPKLSLQFGGSVSKHNDLRAGGGNDSRNAYRRYFGLNNEQIHQVYGDRLQDTGFLQYSADTKAAARLTQDQTLTLRYLHTDLQNVRSYRDQFGGPARIQAAFDPQNLNFGFGRYEKVHVGFLDSLSATFSFNQQNDGFKQQNSLITDPITVDDSSVKSKGYAGQGITHFGRRGVFVFGGEIFDERVNSTRFNVNPVNQSRTQDRPLYPNGSRYVTS